MPFFWTSEHLKMPCQSHLPCEQTSLIIPDLFSLLLSPAGQCDLRLSRVSLFNSHEGELRGEHEKRERKKTTKRRLKGKHGGAPGRRRKTSKKRRKAKKKKTEQREEKRNRNMFSSLL